MLAMIQGKENSLTLLMGVEINPATMEISRKFPQKASGYIPTGITWTSTWRCLYIHVYCYIIHKSQLVESAQISINT